ncbi:hemicentin-2-like [Physella acuta]|uniref:hemicentin-2-like n=1 Tax=Physella acuta TaxID=109671 RepID=UPI0027DB94A0|nr:hemicentin-2-like [Physella acuta]
MKGRNMMFLFLFLLGLTRVETQKHNVLDAPKLESSELGPYVAYTDFLFYLACRSSSDSVLTYQFYKNGELKVRDRWHTYSVNRYNDAYSGNYTCTISNSVGESAHSNSLLLITVGPPTLISTNDDPQIGDDVTLTCQLPIQVLGVKFTWFKDLNRLANASEQVYAVTNISADDAGEYKCSFKINGVRELQSTSFILVLTPPGKPSQSLQLNSSVNVGSSIMFWCNANESLNFGLLKIFLYQNGVKVAERNGSLGYGKFFIQIITMRDSGNYTCTFTNKRGESVQSDPGSIQVNDAEVAKSSLLDVSPIMYKGEQDSQTDCLSTTRGAKSYCTLFINKIRYVDAEDCRFFRPHAVSGSYTCTRNIYNKTGLMSPPVQVTFYNKPRVVPATNFFLNQNFALRCITDVPSGTYFWYKWDNLVYSSNNDTYEFTLTSSMAGSYRCRVKINESDIWSEFYLIRVSRPAKPSLNNNNKKSKLGLKKTVSTNLYCIGDDAEMYSLYMNGIKVSTKPASNNTFTIFLSKSATVQYKCTASNRFGESEPSDPVIINKMESVYITASSIVAFVGQPFSLNCSVENNQSSGSYSWEIHKIAGMDTVMSQNLTINPLTIQDEGVYICHFTKQESTYTVYDYYVLAVSISSVPEIFLRNPAIKGDQGASISILLSTSAAETDVIVRFVCYIYTLIIDGKNPFRLYKNGAVVKKLPYVNELYFSGRFNIRRIYSVDTSVASNEGNYTCTALNSVGESQPSKAVYFTRDLGFKKPQVTMNNVNPQAGDDITLTCNILSPQPDFIITWQKDFSNILKTGLTLSLTSLTVEDHGFYTCTYSNRSNEDDRYFWLEKVSDPILISLLPPLQPILLFDASYLDVKNKYYGYGDGPVFYTFGEGDTLHLKCFVQAMHLANYQIASMNPSPYNFTLYKNGQITQPANTNGMFTISGLSKGDYNYTCQVSREAQLSFMSYSLLVRITDRPTITSSVPSPSLGANLTLTCNTLVESNNIDITWRKNGINMGFTSNVLSLNTISQYDEGSYTCQQTHMEWTSPMSAEFIINFGLVPSKPDILITADTPIQAGSSFAIYCLSTGTPVVSATFYKDGQIIFNATGGYMSDAGQTVFTYQITLAAVTNSGIYSCTVRNSLSVSQISETLNLNVMG